MSAENSKRATALLHSEDRADEEIPDYKNLTEVRVTVPQLTDDIMEEIEIGIDDYMTKNHPDQKGLKSMSDQQILEPLVTILSKLHPDIWDEYSDNFVFTTLKFIIRRRLSNQRRKSKSLKFDAHRGETPFSSTSSNPSVDMEDFALTARLTDRTKAVTISHASVSDIIPSNLAPGRTPLSQVDFKLWAAILRTDLGYTIEHRIDYSFADHVAIVDSGRLLKAAINDARVRGLPAAAFSIHPPPATHNSHQTSQEPLPAKTPLKRSLGAQNTVEGSSQQESRRRRLFHARTVAPNEESSDDGDVGASQGEDTGKGVVATEKVTGAESSKPDYMVRSVETNYLQTQQPADNDEDIDEGEDDELPSTEEMYKKIDFTVAEHLSQERWEDCARLFRHNPRKVTDKDKIKIAGMKSPLYPYQAFGVFVMAQMECWQGGGWNADDMGLGKTVEQLALITLMRILEITHCSVRSARKEKRSDLHLEQGTKEKPQQFESVCPSGNAYGIECPCIDASPSSQMVPIGGPNLVVVPASLVPQWLNMCVVHLDLHDSRFDWQIRHAYGDAKLNKIAKALSAKDCSLVTPQLLNATTPDGPKGIVFGQSRLICVTTTGSYPGHVTKKLGHWHSPPKQTPRSRQPPQQFVPWKLCWGRVIVDEAHIQYSATSFGVRLVQSLGAGPIPRKWFLTGTPFEQSPAQMAHWVGTLQDESWTSKRWFSVWKQKQAHRSNLHICTTQALIALGKEHQRIIEGGEKGGKLTAPYYISNIQKVISTLWLKRSAETSNFLGKPLTESIPNTHHVIGCALPDRFLEMVNLSAAAASAKMMEQHRIATLKWESAKGFKRDAPKINVSQWIGRVRKARILSSWPLLGVHPTTKDLEWTGKEIQDNGWAKTARNQLYELQNSASSPYEALAMTIGTRENSPKAAAVADLISKVWLPDEKAVFCCMSPASALVLYWFIRNVVKGRPALVHGDMSKTKVMEIVSLFQEEPTAMTAHPKEKPPTYIVSTTKLIGVGYTLHKARIQVQFEPEWMERDQQQAKKRVNRIGQTRPTLTYAIRCETSDVEKAIYDRQHRRMWLMNLALDTKMMTEEAFKRGAEDDEDDELKIIEPEDRLPEGLPQAGTI